MFSLLNMNESLAKEMFNDLKRVRLITDDAMDLAAHLNAIYFKLILSIADDSDIKIINYHLNLYENNKLRSIDLVKYFNDLTTNVGVSSNFKKSSFVYLYWIVK